MSKFEEAFNYMIQYEGQTFTDDPIDAGGATKFGISARFISRLNDGDPLPSVLGITGKKFIPNIVNYIRNLTLKDAQWIYEKYFWLPIYEKISEQWAANAIFDMAVNHGHKNAHIIAQRALRCIGFDNIKEDGVLGPMTNSLLDNAVWSMDFATEFPIALKSERAGFMRSIVAHDKSQAKFLNGWLKRAYGEKL